MPRSTGRSDCPFAARAKAAEGSCTLFLRCRPIRAWRATPPMAYNRGGTVPHARFACVRLTAAAEADYQNILAWTLVQFGDLQARVYGDTLSAALVTYTWHVKC